MTLKEKYKEMYGEGENFSNNINKNVYNHRNEFTNDYTNDDFNMNNRNNRNKFESNFDSNFDSTINSNKNLQPTSYMFNLFIIFIIFSFIGIIVYFKDTIIKFYNEMTATKPAINNELKQLNKSIKAEKESREKKEKEKETDKKKETGGINKLVNKINYKANQIAKDDGYCYIGYDKGMRNCGEIYESQICMSGEIFPSLEMCMFPKLRE